MTSNLNNLSGTVAGTVSHAHLLVAESGGLVTLESPEAIMEEVEFRATHVSSLMEEMFAETRKHDFWDLNEA
jgi:hypothetical protein